MFDGTMTTPAQIAATVRKPAALQSGEQRLAALQRRVEETGDEIRRLNGLKDDKTSATINGQLIELDTEQHEARDRVAALRPKVRAARAEHAGKIRKALTPTIAEIAAKGHAAAVQLADALEQLAEVNHVLTAVGAEVVWAPLDPGLEVAITRLDRLRVR